MRARLFRNEECKFEFCVSGLHILITNTLTVVGHEVTLCDGSCKDKLTIREDEVSEDWVARARKELNKGPVTTFGYIP